MTNWFIVVDAVRMRRDTKKEPKRAEKAKKKTKNVVRDPKQIQKSRRVLSCLRGQSKWLYKMWKSSTCRTRHSSWQSSRVCCFSTSSTCSTRACCRAFIKLFDGWGGKSSLDFLAVSRCVATTAVWPMGIKAFWLPCRFAELVAWSRQQFSASTVERRNADYFRKRRENRVAYRRWRAQRERIQVSPRQRSEFISQKTARRATHRRQEVGNARPARVHSRPSRW